MRDSARVRAIRSLFFVSGAAGLIYEVVWSRLLKDLFGITAYAVAAVLATYLGGLALGGWLLSGRADREPNPLRLYALLELAIGEQSWTQSEDVIAEIADGAIDFAYRGLDAGFHLRISAPGGGGLQAHPHGKEGLDDAVVKLTTDAFPLVENREPFQFPLRSPVFKGDGSLDGKRLDELNVLVIEDRAPDHVRHCQRAEGASSRQ